MRARSREKASRSPNCGPYLSKGPHKGEKSLCSRTPLATSPLGFPSSHKKRRKSPLAQQRATWRGHEHAKETNEFEKSWISHRTQCQKKEGGETERSHIQKKVHNVFLKAKIRKNPSGEKKKGVRDQFEEKSTARLQPKGEKCHKPTKAGRKRAPCSASVSGKARKSDLWCYGSFKGIRKMECQFRCRKPTLSYHHKKGKKSSEMKEGLKSSGRKRHSLRKPKNSTRECNGRGGVSIHRIFCNVGHNPP